MNAALLLAGAIVCEVVATSALKASDGFTRIGPSVVTVVGYGLAFWLMALTLRTVPIGIVYAIWSGAGIALIALIGWVVYGERLDAPAMAGIGLILAGVLVLNLFSGSIRQ